MAGTPTRAARWVAGAWWLVVILLVARWSGAEDVPVPLSLQAELLAKVAGYDKNLRARAGDKVRVLLVERPGDADSQRVVVQLRAALERIASIGDMAHEEIVTPWSGPQALATTIRERHAAIVFLSPGFAGDVEGIRDALVGVDVLSATAVSDYVPRGIVLGFDLVSSKPKLLVNLARARKQNVAFSAEVLKIAKVYE